MLPNELASTVSRGLVATRRAIAFRLVKLAIMVLTTWTIPGKLWPPPPLALTHSGGLLICSAMDHGNGHGKAGSVWAKRRTAKAGVIEFGHEVRVDPCFQGFANK